MKTAVVYARYSSERQTEQSIEDNFVFATTMQRETILL